jgi:hypothetical protein
MSELGTADAIVDADVLIGNRPSNSFVDSKSDELEF